MRKTSALPNSGPDSADYPYGYIIDEQGATAGTPVIEATYSDFIQSLWRFFWATNTTPNGLKENQTNGYQLFTAMQKLLDPIGTIKIWPAPGSLPVGYILCLGQSLATATYPELFALIGYTYGGSGANFLLPDMQGRFPLAKSADYPTLGEKFGEKEHVLLNSEMPKHSHKVWGQDNEAKATGGASNEVANVESAGSPSAYFYRWSNESGGGLAHNNMPPYIVINYIIKIRHS